VAVGGGGTRIIKPQAEKKNEIKMSFFGVLFYLVSCPIVSVCGQPTRTARFPALYDV
jgi:hypothetical protein